MKKTGIEKSDCDKLQPYRVWRYGREIGKGDSNHYIWATCVDCGLERWAMLYKNQHTHIRCRPCSQKERSRLMKGRGELNPVWKGGRIIAEDGYVSVRIYPEDFFYPMATQRKGSGYVLEHRLVMAKHLGRCLQPWEKVHHKGIRYSGIENKSDNLIDNLELTTLGSHIREHSKGYRVGYQKGLIDGRDKQIEELRKEIKLLQWQVKETVK